MTKKAPRKLLVDVEHQTARLYAGKRLMDVFNISTAKKGTGNVIGSNQTPTGTLQVAEKIGDGMPLGTIFEERMPTGQWDGVERDSASPILTRILWLEGTEPQNANTKERTIYLHGTSHESKLGTPNSHGCIVFSNKDIVTVFNAMSVGDKVIVVPPPAPQQPPLSPPPQI